MKTINNKDILQGTHYKELETFVNEMCGKFNLQVLDERLVRKLDWKKFEFLPTSYDKFNTHYDKEDIQNIKKKKVVSGVILTYNGLPNCIVWVGTEEDKSNELKYYYHTIGDLREKDDKGYIFSKRLSQLIKKIQTHEVFGRRIVPVSDKKLIKELTRNWGGDYNFYEVFEKLISGDIRTMQNEYTRTSMTGETLHSLLGVLHDDKAFSSTTEHALYKTKVEEMLKYFNEQSQRIQELKDLVRAKLFKPFHLFIQSSRYNSKHNCYALRGSFFEGGDTKEPQLYIFKDGIQYCDSIEEYKDYDSICGRLTMFKNMYPVEETKGELSNLISRKMYQNSSKFYEELEVGHMYFDHKSTNIFFVFE
jgi:hypothetical protein